MRKYIRMTRIYLLVIAVFVLLRFTLELFGPEQFPYRDFELELDDITSEISLTRLFFIIPIFLGLRFVRESLGGWKEMVIANFTYVLWGMGLLMVIHLVDHNLDLGTHYGEGGLGRTVGQVITVSVFRVRRASPLMPPRMPNFCNSIIFTTILTSVLCFVTIKLMGKATAKPADP